MHKEGVFRWTKDKGLMAVDALKGLYVDKLVGKWIYF